MLRLLLFVCLSIHLNSYGYEDYRSNLVIELEDRLFVLNNQGEFVQSYELINEFRKNTANTADENYYSLLYLSYLHKRLSDYDKVQMYLDSAGVYIPQTTNPEQFRINQKCQKCFAYFDAQDYDLAESLMLEIELNVRSNLATDDLSMYYMQQGYIYFLSNKYTLAEEKLKQSERIMNEHLPQHLPIVFTKLMELYAEKGKDSLMNSNFQKSLKIADEYGIKKYTILTYQVRKMIAEKHNDFDGYLKYDLLFDQAENEYNASQHQLEILEIEKQYALEKNANELKQTHQKNRWLIYFSSVVCLVLVLVFIFWRRVVHLSKKLKSQRNDLSVLDKLNKEIFSVISHDLKEPLVSIRFFLDEIKSKGDSNTEKSILDLENQVQITSTILQDLLTWSAVELRVSKDKEETNDLEQIVHASIEQFEQTLTRKNISIELNAIASNNWEIDPWVCSIVIRNLLSNAIKYSDKNSRINVTLTENSIDVIDEGVGLKSSLISSNFDSRQNPNYGTSGESGFGIGLYLCQMLLSRNGFCLKASANTPKGAIFQVIKLN